MRVLFAALVLGICAGEIALAEPTETAIVVHADPTAVREFVGGIGKAPPATGVLARWAAPLCAGVTGVDRAVAQVIIDRIARRAYTFGVRVGASGCDANVMIIMTPNSDIVARNIYERRHTALIAPNGVDASTLGEAALTDFVSTQRPVRWWQIAQTTMADGEMLSDTRGTPFGASTTMSSGSPGISGPSANTGGDRMSGMHFTRSNGTMLQRSTRQDLNYMLIIVDTTRASGVSVGAIADYLAFVSLAQISPTPNVRDYPTILNLFDASVPQRPIAMTDWDMGYLDGLYHSTRTALSARQQQGEITRRMTEANASDTPR